LEYVIFCLYCGGNFCIATVAYLACEDVVLDASVLLFILVSLVEPSSRGCTLWNLHIWALEINVWFVLLDEGTIWENLSVFM
jgi:hypothetical protein